MAAGMALFVIGCMLAGPQALTVSHPKTGRLLKTLATDLGWVESVAFSPNGRQVLASVAQVVKIWNIETGALLLSLSPDPDTTFNSAAFSPNGTRVVTASTGGTFTVWNAAQGKKLLQKSGLSRFAKAEFSPDGKQVVGTAGDDRTVAIWDVETGEKQKELKYHHGHVDSAKFSPDGSNVVTSCRPCSVWVFNATTGKLRGLANHPICSFSAEFSPDGRQVVTGSTSGHATVWDVGDDPDQPWVPRERRKLSGAGQGVRRYVNSAVFSPKVRSLSGCVLGGGERVLTASSDGTARMFDTETGELLKTFKGHASKVSSAVFSPDGSKIVTASYDGTVKVWKA
mmetsp:Transcript_45301/g.137351  ORF Transcript_45301/g.137351 Transcript_45301/m.137351 type:complete len:341 (-) Transcript_45301:106-1128(-)